MGALRFGRIPLWICTSFRGRCPKIRVGLGLGLPLLQECVPQNLGWFCCGSAPRSGVGVPRGFWCGSALCSGVGVPKFCSGSAPHSEVGAPKFRRVLVWICPSLRSGSPIIRENSALGLPLSQEWVPQNLGDFCMSAPHSGVGAPRFVRILFWILPVLRSGSLIIQESSGVDSPRTRDPKICEGLAVRLPRSGLGALTCCGSVFMTSLKGADILCSKGSGCFCSCFMLPNPICWDGTGG